MLVLTRRPGEAIMLGDDVKITVLETKGKQVRLGIEAPDGIAVHRQEIYERIKHAKQASADAAAEALEAELA